MKNDLVVKAAEIAGGASALANKLGVKPPTVHQWINGDRPVPAHRCPDIEAITGGEVTAKQLRPDVYRTAVAATDGSKPEAA